ncbi:hypothetical protein HKD37_07G018656 [Glycine soja]
MENMKMNKDERFAQKGVPIHSQVMKIRQESEKIVDWFPGKPEIRPVLREISRQISRSPLGISGRPISVEVPIFQNIKKRVEVSKEKVSKLGIELDFDLRKILEHLLMKNGSSPLVDRCSHSLLHWANHEPFRPMKSGFFTDSAPVEKHDDRHEVARELTL